MANISAWHRSTILDIEVQYDGWQTKAGHTTVRSADACGWMWIPIFKLFEDTFRMKAS